jgi:hypothetical protein
MCTLVESTDFRGEPDVHRQNNYHCGDPKYCMNFICDISAQHNIKKSGFSRRAVDPLCQRADMATSDHVILKMGSKKYNEAVHWIQLTRRSLLVED